MNDRELRGSISANLLRRQPAELLKIKIGRMGEERRKSSGNGTYRLPEKLDHFLVTRRERKDGDQDANFVRADEVHERIGDEPTELKVRLMFDDPEDNFFSQMQRYDGRERIRECDGEVARDPRNDTTEPCRHPDCRCKPYGRLQVILEAAPTFGSVAVFRTTSWETVRNLLTALEMLHGQFGFLMGLPLKLKIYPATDRYEQGGNVRSSTSYKVALELDGSFEDAREIALEAHQKRVTSGTGEDFKQIAAAQAEELARLDDEEEEEIVEEFHPDPNAKADVETAERVEDIKRRAEIVEDEDGGGSEGASEAEAESGAETPSEASAEQEEEGQGGEEPGERPQKQALWQWLLSTYHAAEEAVARWGGLAEGHPDLPDDPTTWDEDTCEQALAFVKRHGPEGVESPEAFIGQQTEAL